MKKTFKIFTFSSISFLSLFLTSCDTSDLQDNLSNIGNKILPNIWVFLVQFISLLVMVLFIIFFAYKPIKKYMNKRKEELDNEIKIAKLSQEEADANILKSKKVIEESKNKAKDIIQFAEIEANARKKDIINSANKEASDLIKDSKKRMENDRIETENDIKNEIINVAIRASSKILEREVNDSDNRKIVDDFLKELDSNGENNEK